MKNLNKKLIILGITIGLLLPLNAMKKVAVMNFDINSKKITSQDFGQLIRYELDKLNTYEVVDKYEMVEKMKNVPLDLSKCYSKSCMLEAGKKLNSDYVIGGTIEQILGKIFFKIRMIDVKNNNEFKNITLEFLPLNDQTHLMAKVALYKLLGLKIEERVLSQLQDPEAQNSGLNHPLYKKLNLSGPRMGAAILTGKNAKDFAISKDKGGYGGTPVMTQFGYQFEKQYLSQRNFQALAEFIPSVAGLEQGLFIPSFTFMNGFRNSKTGLEFGMGPSFVFNKTSTGLYDGDGIWTPDSTNTKGFSDSRLDPAGEVTISTSVIFAAGITLRSGRLNIPINAYFVPSKNGNRYGVSFGFNISN